MDASVTYLSRAGRLRQMLHSLELEFIMEAHNGLSARIVEEAGFSGIWASGLALSAQFGVRDNNEASWTQIVDMMEFMGDASSLPILLDGDTGYGNFNNLRRLVRKLEQRGVAGVCIEDKLFPKTNSFINGEQQELADIDEFCGKIKAGKDTQHDPDFNIVARVEALIAGLGLGEALKRAEAYRQAGADAILIHSKTSQPDEILAFCREWANRAPVVIVPTKYYSTPTDVFRRAGVSLCIWANHLIRSAIPAMQATAREVFERQTLTGIEDRIAPVNEIFRLQGADEYEEAEKLYLASAKTVNAIILGANRGDSLEALTHDRPKMMVPVSGEPLLKRLADSLRKQGVRDITAVAGYRADAVKVEGVRVLVNAGYESGGELATLYCARDHFSDDMIILFGDLLFRGYVLRDLLESTADITVVVDSAWPHDKPTPDLAWCSAPDERALFRQSVELRHIAGCTACPEGGPPHGRWIGMVRVRAAGRLRLREAIERLHVSEHPALGIADVLNETVAAGDRVKVLYINGNWLDVNDHEDLARAGLFTQGAAALDSPGL